MDDTCCLEWLWIFPVKADVKVYLARTSELQQQIAFVFYFYTEVGVHVENTFVSVAYKQQSSVTFWP